MAQRHRHIYYYYLLLWPKRLLIRPKCLIIYPKWNGTIIITKYFHGKVCFGIIYYLLRPAQEVFWLVGKCGILYNIPVAFISKFLTK